MSEGLTLSTLQPPKAAVVCGDLWQLDEQILLCADARRVREFARLMNGEAAAALASARALGAFAARLVPGATIH